MAILQLVYPPVDGHMDFSLFFFIINKAAFTREAEAGGSLRLRPAWTAEFYVLGLHREKPVLEKKKKTNQFL